MAKSKSKAVIMASDGAGGMTQLYDGRFESGDWPIRFDVPNQQAETWLQYLSAECGRRGWSSGSIGQLDAKENSGSITISVGAGAAQPQLVVVWERKRNGPIKVRARSMGVPECPHTLAQELFERVNERCVLGVKERFYLRGQLHYEGLPWRGEIWLSDALRLGPPSKQDETALLGPRVILIDAQVDGIDRMDAGSAFAVRCRELSVFLSVVMRKQVLNHSLSTTGRAWTFAVEPGARESDVRFLGYIETDCPQEMPSEGQAPPALLVPVRRPDFSLTFALWPGDVEQKLPADILELWQLFSGLPTDRRRQFLQVGSMWQAALRLGHEYQTAAFAWMVAACEALKPSEPEFRDHNIYHVTEALLGKARADLLREEWFRAQQVRSAHLHGGEFRGAEFVQRLMMSSFQDPTFDQAHRVLAEITPAAIIEWLRQGGTFTMPPLRRPPSWRRWARKNALTGLGIALGLVLGWLVRVVWRG